MQIPQPQRVIIIIARRYFYAKCGADGGHNIRKGLRHGDATLVLNPEWNNPKGLFDDFQSLVASLHDIYASVKTLEAYRSGIFGGNHCYAGCRVDCHVGSLVKGHSL